MPHYLISFPDGAMTFPAEDLPDVARDSHAVVDEARAAGVWVYGGGIDTHAVTVVGTDGSVSEEQSAAGSHIGGFCVLDVESHDEALRWAARIAASCRCAQEVRRIMDDVEA